MTPQPPSNAPRRLGSAEVASAICFLGAAPSSRVDGAEPPIDGGRHA